MPSFTVPLRAISSEALLVLPGSCLVYLILSGWITLFVMATLEPSKAQHENHRSALKGTEDGVVQRSYLVR